MDVLTPDEVEEMIEMIQGMRLCGTSSVILGNDAISIRQGDRGFRLDLSDGRALLLSE